MAVRLIKWERKPCPVPQLLTQALYDIDPDCSREADRGFSPLDARLIEALDKALEGRALLCRQLLQRIPENLLDGQRRAMAGQGDRSLAQLPAGKDRTQLRLRGRSCFRAGPTGRTAPRSKAPTRPQPASGSCFPCRPFSPPWPHCRSRCAG